MATIRNPIEWGWDRLRLAAVAVGSTVRAVRGTQENRYSSPAAVRRIEASDLKDVLARGLGDFGAFRTDVIFPLPHLSHSGPCPGSACIPP